jgi:ubiquinone/menaquinone biosynthesis C-methylase UbiE
MWTTDQEMRRYYAARAPEYDRVYQKPERQPDIRRLQQWLPPLFAGARVLDVAAGTGFWTRHFAPVAREVVLLDTSAETLEIARGRLAAGSCRFVVADAYDLPDTLGTFDAAFAGFWFSHVPVARREKFVAGFVRRVRAGGEIVLIDNRYVEGSSQPISHVDQHGNSYQTRRLEDGSAHRVLKNFPSREELESAVQPYAASTVHEELEYFWAFRSVLR